MYIQSVLTVREHVIKIYALIYQLKGRLEQNKWLTGSGCQITHTYILQFSKGFKKTQVRWNRGHFWV